MEITFVLSNLINFGICDKILKLVKFNYWKLLLYCQNLTQLSFNYLTALILLQLFPQFLEYKVAIKWK